MNTVKDIMTTDLLSVKDDWSLESLSQFFFDHNVSGAPVVDANEKLIGIVSLTDLARNNTLPPTHPSSETTHHYYLNSDTHQSISQDDLAMLNMESESIVTVKDIMTPMIFEVDEDTSIGKTADMMLKGRIHRVFVTRDKKIVGIVTTMDMLKVIRDPK